MIGLDVGSKRIGVAVSDELEVIASPHGAIVRSSYNRDAAAIANLVQQHSASCIVVGLPLTMAGGASKQTERIQHFAAMLAERVDVPVELWDERLTTSMAHAIVPNSPRARRSGAIDAVAAAFILQGYLDQRSSSH